MTYPDEWRGGTLTLAVRHSALLRELQQSLELIRNAVCREFPETLCNEVKLTIAGGVSRRRRISK